MKRTVGFLIAALLIASPLCFATQSVFVYSPNGLGQLQASPIQQAPLLGPVEDHVILDILDEQIVLTTTLQPMLSVDFKHQVIQIGETPIRRSEDETYYMQWLQEAIYLTIRVLNTVEGQTSEQVRLRKLETLDVLERLLLEHDTDLKVSAIRQKARPRKIQALYVYRVHGTLFAQVQFDAQLRATKLRFYAEENGSVSERVVFNAPTGKRLSATSYDALGERTADVSFDLLTGAATSINGFVLD